MKRTIAAIGPSMVDLAMTLQPEQALLLEEKYDLEAGGWLALETEEAKDDFLEDVGVASDHLDPSDPHAAGFSLSAGSSMLGVLSALPAEARKWSTLASTIPMQEDKIDPAFQIFKQAVTGMGAHHAGTPAPGANPLGLVLSQPQNTEKLLATFAGAANDLDYCEQLDKLHSHYLIADSYELRSGKIATYIEELITSRRFKVALSLGNHSILNTALTAKIRGFMENGQIEILCGNESEFNRLYSELPPEHTSTDGFIDHPVKNMVPYVMLTRGANGLSCLWENAYYNQGAVPARRETIINTSGAGDTAMGGFCHGVIYQEGPAETLRKAAYLATQVLTSASSRYINPASH